MTTTTGTVDFVKGPNDYGFFSVKISGTWYGVGKGKPDIAKGDIVEFDSYLKDGKFATVKGGFKKVAGEAAPAASSGQSTSKSSYAAKDDYWAAKEKYDKETTQPRIALQAARKDALTHVALLLSQGAIPGLDKPKVDKVSILDAFVLDYTLKFYNQTQAIPKLNSPKAEKQEDKSEDEQQEEGWE